MLVARADTWDWRKACSYTWCWSAREDWGIKQAVGVDDLAMLLTHAGFDWASCCAPRGIEDRRYFIEADEVICLLDDRSA